MFEETTSSSQVLTTSNFLKGGDFMVSEQNNPDRQAAIADAIRRMEWEGGPVSTESNPPVKNSRFPERVGRIRFKDSLEIATSVDSTGNPEIDPVVFKSVSRMDAGE